MKILIIGSHVETLDEVRSFSDMWLHYLWRSLTGRGVEVLFHRRFIRGANSGEYVESVLAAAKGCSGILAPGVRYFTEIPDEIGKQLRHQFGGWVAHTYDGSLLDCPVVDVTFTIKDDAYRFNDSPSKLQRHRENNVATGWAADPELFYPEKRDGRELRIFVDHAAFDVSGFDYSLSAMMNLRHLNRPFIARTLTDEGIVTIDPENVSVAAYRRKPVSARVLASELRKTDVFVVTHPESLGQTVLEAAMCGALIIAPENTLPADRLALVNHVIYGSRINWDEVIENIDHEGNASRVSGCTWDAIAKTIIKTFEGVKPC